MRKVLEVNLYALFLSPFHVLFNNFNLKYEFIITLITHILSDIKNLCDTVEILKLNIGEKKELIPEWVKNHYVIILAVLLD